MNPERLEIRLKLTPDQFETISRALLHMARNHSEASVREAAIDTVEAISNQELLAFRDSFPEEMTFLCAPDRKDGTRSSG